MEARTEEGNNTIIVVSEIREKVVIIEGARPEVSIRKAMPEDYESILAIVNDELDDSYLEEALQQLKDLQVGKATAFVADLNGLIVGYACWRKRIQIAYLEIIVISKQYQQNGIGSLLLRGIISSVKHEMPAMGLLNAVTDSDAKDAISFYIKNGFIIAGTVDNEFIPGLNQVHMALNLGESCA